MHGGNPEQQVHFVVLRMKENGQLQMQSSKVEPLDIPEAVKTGNVSRRHAFLKDELFFDKCNSSRYQIDIYRVRFYSCMRQSKLVTAFLN